MAGLKGLGCNVLFPKIWRGNICGLNRAGALGKKNQNTEKQEIFPVHN